MSTPSGAAPRRPGSAHGITGLRFLPLNIPASLLNISPTGLLAESNGKMTVGASATLAIEGGFNPSTVTGRVVRCEVAAMGRDGQLRYHLGVEFEQPLALGDPQSPPSPPGPPPVRNRW